MILSGGYWNILRGHLPRVASPGRMNQRIDPRIERRVEDVRLLLDRETCPCLRWKSHIAAGRIIFVEKPLPRAISREICACSMAFS